MTKYIVTEVVKYEVEADDEEGACDVIVHSENRDQYCCGVEDRYAEIKAGERPDEVAHES